MATLFDWAGLLLTHKGIVISLWVLIAGSVSTNVGQYFEVEAKATEVENTRKQVTAVAQSLSTATVSTPICDCRPFMDKLNNHIRNH